MKSKLALILLLIVAGSNTAYAHCKDHKYYAGGGLGFNSDSAADSSEASGFQFLGGYCLPYNFKSRKSTTSIEVGYMTTGDFDHSSSTTINKPNGKTTVTNSAGSNSYQGLWVSGVAEYKFESQLNLLGRVGYDIGDDNGVMIGGGVGYNLSRWAQLRAEYVSRNETDSVQFNWISEF